MNKRGSIVFYMPNLAGGGIERVTLLLASGFILAGYAVTFLLQSADGELIDKVPANVKVVNLNVSRTLQALVPLIRFLRLETPDVFVTSYGHNNIVALWAKLLSRSSVPVVVTQHNALSAESVKGKGLQFSRVLPCLYRLFLRFADAVVAVSTGIADEMAAITRLDRRKIDVIYNPVIPPTFDQDVAEACDHPWFKEGAPPVILGVGRFVELKGFSILIAAFAKVARKREARLVLLGDGHLREQLEAQAKTLGLEGRIDFPGFRPNPLPYMRRAAVLALTSTHEGFGNVLVEAMACGTPVVSTDCQYGPPEILGNGRYGKLVPVGDSAALAAAILSTLDHPCDPQVLRARGFEFTVQKSVDSYLGLFSRLTQPHSQEPCRGPGRARI
jgi:glycosyltransferase involved in cell wall biosynthesis